jgi:hypothetical protein
MNGPSGERPKSCYGVYSKALLTGFFICTFTTVMHDGNVSVHQAQYEISSDPEMQYVFDNLPGDMGYEEKIGFIESLYGTKYDMLHLWDVFGIIPKLKQLEAFLTATYTNAAAFETQKPEGGSSLVGHVANDAREKIYKFSFLLNVRPATTLPARRIRASRLDAVY